MREVWSISRQQSEINNVLARYAVPAVVYPPLTEDPKAWIITFDSHFQAILDLLHDKQNKVFDRCVSGGIERMSKTDALFMFASQWLEWMLVRAKDDPDDAEMFELIENWFTIYLYRGTKHLN